MNWMNDVPSPAPKPALRAYVILDPQNDDAAWAAAENAEIWFLSEPMPAGGTGEIRSSAIRIPVRAIPPAGKSSLN